MRGREVLPLQTGSGKFLLHRLDELIDEVEIRLAANPFVAPAEVFRILKSFGVVGSHIQHDRQRPFRTNPADERIQGKLADRDAQAACALVADAQDALAVGDDNYVDLRIGTIRKSAGMESRSG